jgi:hypothetical protein
MEGLPRNKSSECYELALIASEVKPKTSEKNFALANPFYLPTQDSELYKHREKKRLEDELEKRKLQEYKLHEKYKFDERRSIFPEIRDKGGYFLDFGPASNSRPLINTKKETIRELIQRKREILLTKKSIENKKAKYLELEADILKSEEKIKDERKRLTDNECKIKKFEETRKKSYDQTVQKAKELQKTKTDKSDELKRCQDELDQLKTNIEKKNEELNRLVDYKNFVEELLPNNGILDTFVTSSSFMIDDYRDKLIEAMNSLETKNLFQIQQKQEDEYEHESLRRQNELTVEKNEKKIKEMGSNLQGLETQLKSLQEKALKMKGSKANEANEKKGSGKKSENPKHFETHPSEIIPPVVRTALEHLFAVVEEEKSNIPTKELEILEILEKIEEKLNIEERILKEKIGNSRKLEDFVIEREKSAEKGRRSLKIDEERKKINDEANKRKQESVKEIIKRQGRHEMQRSRLPEKIEVKKPPKESQEVLDWREFLGDED